MATLTQITSPPQAGAEFVVNENFETLEHQGVYGKRQSATTGLTWGYYGGRWGGFSIADGTFTLDPSDTTYIVVEKSTGATTADVANTDWLDTTNFVRVYAVTTSASAVTAVEDHRAGPSGVHGGAGGGGGGGSAASVTIADAGTYYTGTDVEAALQEVGATLGALGTAAAIDIDTDGTLAANSDAKIATQKAVKTYVDAAVAAASGGAVGLEYAASTTTSDADPGAGVLRWNNSTQGSATFLYIDNVDGDATSIATVWAGLPAGSAITITDANDPDKWQRWRTTATPTDGTGYYKFPVTLEAQEGSNVANAAAILIDVDVGSVAGGQKVEYTIACSDTITPLTVGTTNGFFRPRFDLTGLTVYANLLVAQTSGSTFTVDVKKNGTTILSTLLTIDNTERDSATAGSAAVVSVSTCSAGDEFTFAITQVGDGTAKGLEVTVVGTRDAGAGGADGTDGADGLNLLTTSGAPSNGTGRNGEYAYDPTTRIMYGPKAGGVWPGGVALAALQRTVLGSDVTNNNGSANTIADVTALSFAVISGSTYKFRFEIRYTAAATTTGSRWSINGPTTTFLTYRSDYSLSTTSRTFNEGVTAYDTPSASNATSAATGGNTAVIEGIIKPSANGTVIARFASEVSSSAIVAKAGSYVEYEAIA